MGRVSELIVPARFCGPPRSANGGWTSGALAALLRGVPAPPIEVTLRVPPPLDTPMPVTAAVTEESAGDVGRVVARHAGSTVAEARLAAEAEIEPVPPVSADAARAAEASYAGLRHHPFPGCYVCGPERADGLRIFPGVVERSPARVAATWTPAPDTRDGTAGHTTTAIAWAALDCVGGWAGDLAERPMVLGRITAAVDALPEIGEEHVVLGEARGVEGRKVHTASTLYGADGRIVGRARHVWFTIDPADFS